MIYRVLILTLLLSTSAHAKPSHHSTSNQDKSSASQTISHASEDDLSKQLTSHNWQITQVSKQPGFALDPDHWIFNFSSGGKYKAFGTCNYLGGNFKADGAGAFRISNLDGSNNRCEDAKEEETMVFNMLLLADSFEISGDGLLLKSNGQALIGLKASDKEVDRSVAHKSRVERGDGKSKSKKTGKGRQGKKDKPKAKSSQKDNNTQTSHDAKRSHLKHQGKHQLGGCPVFCVNVG